MTSQDEADQKYENIVCMSLRGLIIFINHYFSGPKSPTGSIEKFEKIFNDPKFWKLSKDHSTKVFVLFILHNLRSQWPRIKHYYVINELDSC